MLSHEPNRQEANRTPIEVVLDAFKRTTGHDPAKSGVSGWKTCCPAHDDHNPSLSVSEAEDGRVLLNCLTGCEFDRVLEACGLSKRDLFPDAGGYHSSSTSSLPHRRPVTGIGERRKSKPSGQAWPTSAEAIDYLERKRGPRCAAWTYRDAEWNEIGIVIRWDQKGGGKNILPLNHSADGWRIGAMPEPRPLYLLPDVIDAEVVYVVEGEKAADAAKSIGLTVTTSCSGSNAAGMSDWSPLAGKRVVIIPDNDKPGSKYAQTVADIVTSLDPPATVRIVDLTDDWSELPEKGDIDDWCEQFDGTEPETPRRRIEALAERSEPWIPRTAGKASQRNGLVHRAVLQRFSEVEPESLRWLWPGRIPSGMLTVVSGNPAGGKSFVMVDIVARVTAGRAWPDGADAEEPGDVIMVNVEDAVAVVQRPRLDAAEADVERVRRIDSIELSDGGNIIEQRSFCIMQAAEVLRSAVEQLERPRLVVLDPLAAFLAGVRSNDQGDIRAAFTPLVQLAEDFDVAIVFVHHNRKGTGSHASERLSGSLQIGATVRQSWEVVRDPEDENRRLLLPGKNSNARDCGGLAFRIVDTDISLSENDDFVGRVEWEPGVIDLSADEFTRCQADEQSRDPWPVEWLRDHLNDGPKAASEVSRAAKTDGLSGKQIRTARERLKVVPYKSDFKGGWIWELPDSELGSSADSAKPPEAA